jgi:hypothetical protein
VVSVATSVSNRPPQRVGGTTGNGPPPSSSKKNASGSSTKPTSTRPMLAVCTRRTTQIQNTANAAKQVHGRQS